MSHTAATDAETIAKFKRNSMYDAPSSRKLRADAERQPNDIDRLRVRHLDEKAALGAEHRAASLALVATQATRRSKDRAVMNGAPPPDLLRKMDLRERAAMEAHHRALDAKLAERQTPEMAAAIARHRVP